MVPAFRAALSRIEENAPWRGRFIEFWAMLAMFYADHPTQELLPVLVHDGTVGDRVGFAAYVGNFLRTMESGAKRPIWKCWRKRYRQQRLVGVRALLEDREIAKMLGWLAHLGGIFDEALTVAMRGPPVVLDYSSFLLALRESKLVIQFPETAAQLLIYLCDCDCVCEYMVADLARIAKRLPLLP
jgi:hypothetical protein